MSERIKFFQLYPFKRPEAYRRPLRCPMLRVAIAPDSLCQVEMRRQGRIFLVVAIWLCKCVALPVRRGNARVHSARVRQSLRVRRNSVRLACFNRSVRMMR